MYKSWMWKQRSFREQFQSDEHAGGAGGAAAEQQEEQQAEAEQPEGEQPAEQDEQPDPAAEEEEVVITLGDETPAPTEEDQLELSPQQNAAWARMRKAERELKARVRELEQAAQQAGHQPAAPKTDDIGPEPTLEGCEFDAEAYAEAKVAHIEKKRAAEAKAAAARQEQEATQAEWNKQLSAYRAAGAALKVSGFEDAEAAVTAVLNPTQVGIMLQGPNAQQAAQLVAALGRAPAELKKLADIKNPVKYAFAVAELVGKLKVQSKKQPPAAERTVRPSAGGATAVDSTEARLEAEADKTGNRTALIAYRKQKEAKAKAAA